MRISVTVMDATGHAFQGETDLSPVRAQRSDRKKTAGAQQLALAATVNFASPI
jgi:hypothetical protein